MDRQTPLPCPTKTTDTGENPTDVGATSGDDLITGTNGADLIRGLSGDDTISALSGDDVIEGNAGRDAILAGPGDDVARGGAGSDRLFGGLGDDRMIGGAGDDLFDDISGADDFFGGAGDDIILALDSTLGAPDHIAGGEGDDRMWGDDGDRMTGGEGADRFMVPTGREGAAPVVITDLDFSRADYGERPDQVFFTDPEGANYPRSAFFDGSLNAGIGDMPDGSGASIVFGSQQVAIIQGYTAEELFHQTIWIGNFQVYEEGLGEAGEVLTGTAGDDHLNGGAGDDSLTGSAGGDWLRGRDGDDLLDGRDGEGAQGADTVFGGAGWDTIRADDGDFIAGFEGRDSYELTLIDGDAEPITVFGYEVLSEDGTPEPVTLVDENGIPLSAEEVAAGVTLEASDEGAGTLVLYEGQAVAHLLGVTPCGDHRAQHMAGEPRRE
ncbi:calcium-binding protein [Sulfitobacter faviae]|uniref:Calcium-binding protein n=1 Tax=Sulfitobacter faviae TaxID=1775881 RepID=A0ABZ0V1B7_9RHOB|nr:calcium-binding protein [Sulfitobacter faviae]WPZ22413.1 calcium-binding protein [Sulfitobacter faviae]